MKEKIKELIKKKWFMVTAALIVLGILLYGVGRLAFAYDVIKWEGAFQYSKNNWSYSTKSYIVASWNGKKTEKIYSGTGGFERDGSTANTTKLTVNQDELLAYLEKEYEWTPEVGDIVHWEADAEVTFKYKDTSTGGTVLQEKYGSIADAEYANDYTSHYVKMGAQADGFEIDDEWWDDTGITL